ncbi:protein kinase domain-containing protein [Leptolyngbya sp. 7M]|uniref:protein kinase domain-containing protein n=1 Tax=Leptolyngbya sp. 7M TaxID=2812896 RepID=UPI001B8A99A0|nr:protein kinase [Leptolyngbya sp. 7M]QYO67056.1 protein kinase [Leptolyngbya sp. 7M]
MGKLVLLKLGDGSLEQGFPVALQFGEEGQHPSVETIGRLPAAPELYQAYQDWAGAYRSLNQRLRLDAETIQHLNVSKREACQSAAHALTDGLNGWLYAASFRPIREKLLEQLMPSDQVRMIVQTPNLDVRRLPWHLWDFCDRYPKSEIALGASIYERVAAIRPDKLGVNVLAILGNSNGIDTQTDRRLLEQLSGATVSFLVEPTRQALTQELWRQNWDILFFAGHSYTDGNRGQIALNQTDSLTLDQLKYALRRVVERGLQVAIFNSCDGLGLARELEDLHIPQIIVMREPVPDQVAQEFLKSFLTAFAQGEPFYLAVREAREILQGIEDEYPCATWLPVICQNPAVIPPTWQELGGRLRHLAAPTQPLLEEAPFQPLPPAPEPTLINDRYQIQRQIGQGGFGRTYLAADTYRFGDLCVLKEFAPANRNPTVLQRSRQLFEREAKVLYQISHPQIPKFLAWFTQENRLFIVEEYIDGKTYLELLEERQQQGETFSEVEVIQWLQDLLPVLQYLHGMNIIHRDISPGNVILPQRRSPPVLIDFGIVKEVASQIWARQLGSLQSLHQASRIGKPGYAPPEQMQLGQCFPSSDLYSLGMTALVLLTGRNPLWLLEQTNSEPRWHSQVSAKLRPIFAKLLSENPRHRYPSAQAALADLQVLLSFQPSPEQTTAQPQPDAVTLAPQPAAPALSSTFLDHCQRELTHCIGPMAAYILDDILTQQPQLTATALIESLAAEIPDLKQANQFRTRASL